jgi:hypothetical protein
MASAGSWRNNNINYIGGEFYMSDTYNGWTNYETWKANLEIFDGYEPEKGQYNDIHSLVEALKEMADDVLTNYGMLEDCIALSWARSMMSEVNFYEIAEHMADDYELFNDDESEE